MPRIPDHLFQSVAFIYPDRAAAQEGGSIGGTGFVVRYQSAGAARANHFLITNIHVALMKDRTIRFKTTSEKFDFLDITGSQWIYHPNSDDIAVAAIDLHPEWNIAPLDWSAIAATQARLTELNVGIGDEVFMVGRFVSSDLQPIDNPLARFGNITMMPGPLVNDGRGMDVEAFLAEMRSQSGFSGSPVFVYVGPGTYRGNGTMMPFYSEQLGLIGIDTGHKVTETPVRRRDEPSATDLIVQVNTGISIVSPVWKIEEALECATQA